MRRRVLASLGGGWVNPYVTDGLVAMWHGVFSQFTDGKWVDVVNGYEFDVISGSAEKGQNTLEGNRLLATCSVCPEIESALKTSRWTIEIVTKFNSITNGNYYSTGITDYRNIEWILESGKDFKIGGNNFFWQEKVVSVSSGSIANTAAIRNGAAFSAFNGSEKIFEKNFSWNENAYNGLKIGGRRGATTSSVDTSTCAIRVYNHPLSTEERHKNVLADGTFWI